MKRTKAVKKGIEALSKRKKVRSEFFDQRCSAHWCFKSLTFCGLRTIYDPGPDKSGVRSVGEGGELRCGVVVEVFVRPVSNLCTRVYGGAG